MLMYDVGHINYSSIDRLSFLDYIKERSDYIFDKYVNKFDRVSIAKFNANIEMDTLCKLTIK